jgi:hypothetical protein
MLLVDDLLAHSECRAAYELASYLASSPPDFPTRSSSGLTENDVGVMIFMRLVATLAAIQGGLYPRAHTTLLQAHQLARAMSPSTVKNRLMASLHVLFCRLAQVEGLPQRSVQHLDIVNQLLFPGRLLGVSLLQARSELESSPTRALSMLVEGQAAAEVARAEGKPDLARDEYDHVLGSYARHYLHYLTGRIYIELEQWNDAERELAGAEEALRAIAHRERTDPLREAFVKVARARIKVGRGGASSGGTREVDEGCRELREAVSLFRSLSFTPGEYLSRRYLTEARRSERGTAEAVQAYKELLDLARRSGVLRFNLQAAVWYAEEVREYGRPNAAHAALGAFASAPTGFASELAADALWKRAETLFAQTADALENGVNPRHMWGLSSHAEDERDFVVSVSDDPNVLVSVYGPPGSGRRILLERIARARGLLKPNYPAPYGLSVVTAARRSAEEVQRELAELIAGDTGIVLYDFDIWPPEAQWRAHRLIQPLEEQGVSWRQRLFVTLTERLERAEARNRIVSAWIVLLDRRYSWNIQPLKQRPKDTLLLARGFLIHALNARNAFATEGETKCLIFTSESARHIRETYSHIGALFRAMRSVASGLRVEFDVFDAPGPGTPYKKVPLEVIRRLLPLEPDIDADAPQPRPAALPPLRSRADITKVDAATVAELAIRYDGRLAVLAGQHKIPRSNLLRAWRARGVLDAWFANGGRTTRPRVVKRG